MTPKTTGLLALIALALGAFVFFHEIEGGRTREAAIEDARKIHVGFEANDVTAVSLTTLDGVPARFERLEGRWELVTPIRARADTTALDAIVHALVNMPREGSIESSGSLSAFGLGAQAAAIRFEVAGEKRGLRIGRTTPVGGHRYVARLGDDEVAFVASYRVNAFKRNLDDLRDRRIFQFEAGDVRTLRVGWSEGPGRREIEVAMARDAKGDWQIGVPLVGLADADVVRDLLSNLAYLRADGFIDEPPSGVDRAISEALDETAIRFHWTVEGAHLERGARVAGEVDGQRVIEAPDGRLYTIAAERLDDFPRAVVDFRFKRMSSFEVSLARRLEMEFAWTAEDEVGSSGIDESPARPLRVVAELGESGWSSAEPPIDPDRASRLVRELASLRAVDIFADEMGANELASLGLNPPQARIRVEGGADPAGKTATLAELLIGRFDPDRGFFAQRGNVSTVFLLEAQAAEDLPVSAQRYRSDFEVVASDGVESSEGEGGASNEGPAESFEADPLEGLELP